MHKERRVVFLTASNEALRQASKALLGGHPVQLESGDPGSAPKVPAETWVCAVEFGEAQLLSCSSTEWDGAVRMPLQHAFLSVQAAARTLPRGGRILVIGIVAPQAVPGGGQVGLAALACLFRSLAIETVSSSISVYGLATSSVSNLPHSLLSGLLHGEAAFPSGTWVDLRDEVSARAVQQPATSAQSGRRTRARPEVAIVTGAGRGLGRAIAERLAAGGAVVLLFDQDPEALQSAQMALKQRGFEAAGFVGDVACRADIARAAREAAARWGHLDMWVNNAAVACSGAISELELANWDRTLDVNVNGTLWGCQVALSEMQNLGGAILNMSSTASRTAGLVYPGRYNAYAPYAASKAGVEALTRIFSGPAAAQSVRVNALAPGPILTELTERIYSQHDRTELEVHIPLGRLGRPEDVSMAAAFLLSAEADFINGHVLVLDGGLTALPATKGFQS